MNATAANGILIVAMLFAWGMHASDKWLMTAALAAAVASWVVNILEPTGRTAANWQHATRLVGAWLAVAFVALACFRVLFVVNLGT
jgi:hypothetical protein